MMNKPIDRDAKSFGRTVNYYTANAAGHFGPARGYREPRGLRVLKWSAWLLVGCMAAFIFTAKVRAADIDVRPLPDGPRVLLWCQPAAVAGVFDCSPVGHYRDRAACLSAAFAVNAMSLRPPDEGGVPGSAAFCRPGPTS